MTHTYIHHEAQGGRSSQVRDTCNTCLKCIFTKERRRQNGRSKFGSHVSIHVCIYHGARSSQSSQVRDTWIVCLVCILTKERCQTRRSEFVSHIGDSYIHHVSLIYTPIYIPTFAGMYICIYLYSRTYMYIHIHTYTHIYTYIYTYLYPHIYLCSYTHLYSWLIYTSIFVYHSSPIQIQLNVIRKYLVRKWSSWLISVAHM